jgi:hypothetical protein
VPFLCPPHYTVRHKKSKKCPLIDKLTKNVPAAALKVTTKAFGTGCRMPIAQRFRDG